MTAGMLLALIFNGVLVTICFYALVRGGRPERIGAGINIIASSVTTGLRLMNPQFYAPAELLVLSIDTLVVGGFFWLAISTTRFWPIWAFGFAVANIFVSLAGGLIPQVPLFAYLTGLGFYAYLALASLAIGTFYVPSGASLAFRDGRRVATRSLRIEDGRSSVLRRAADFVMRRRRIMIDGAVASDVAHPLPPDASAQR